ncbi:hypothetical protein IGI04_041567 [Brassica rapa subsp. trilocularis]|uniref:Uncharacterized protein n=1 Tax=Brassica rapa subsp. trilocularis TaxID=1813537 RepID=A0ABQ7KV86_BRACM|nr:hypothetical protein IGI04_041567 [Brassica rapa subsp. trilocularis]
MVSEDVLISGTIIQILNHVHPQKHRREVRLLRESKEHRVWTSPDSGKELCRKNSAFQHPFSNFCDQDSFFSSLFFEQKY